MSAVMRNKIREPLWVFLVHYEGRGGAEVKMIPAVQVWREESRRTALVIRTFFLPGWGKMTFFSAMIVFLGSRLGSMATKEVNRVV